MRLEIDLTDSNAGPLADALAPILAKAGWGPRRRRSGHRAAPLVVTETLRRAATRPEPANPHYAAEVREWAQAAGLDVADKGRMSDDVVARWRARNRRGRSSRGD